MCASHQYWDTQRGAASFAWPFPLLSHCPVRLIHTVHTYLSPIFLAVIIIYVCFLWLFVAVLLTSATEMAVDAEVNC